MLHCPKPHLSPMLDRHTTFGASNALYRRLLRGCIKIIHPWMPLCKLPLGNLSFPVLAKSSNNQHKHTTYQSSTSGYHHVSITQYSKIVSLTNCKSPSYPNTINHGHNTANTPSRKAILNNVFAADDGCSINWTSLCTRSVFAVGCHWA